MKRLLMVAIAVGTTAFSFLPVAAAQKKMAVPACGESSGARYCIFLAASPGQAAVLYYFHGNGESEKSWDNPTRQRLYDYWESQSQDAPTVVSISFGKTFFLNEEIVRLLDERIFPSIERLLPHPVKNRSALGESMGGFNAAVLAFRARTPFQKVAIRCPAIYPVSPFAPTSELEKFSSSLDAIAAKFFRKWLQKQASYFPTQAQWQQSDPLELARTLRPRPKQLFLEANTGDPLGVFAGAELLRARLTQAIPDLKWHPVAGQAHCVSSEASERAMANFLVR